MAAGKARNVYRSALSPLLLLLLGVSAWRTFADTAASPTANYDFEKMSRLIKRLDVLEGLAEQTLLGFYEPRLCSFSVKPGAAQTKRVCVTSTCYALLTLLPVLSSAGVYDSVFSYENDASYTSKSSKNKSAESGIKIPIRRVISTLLTSKWREGTCVRNFL